MESRYFQLFINDFSYMSYIYILINKSESFEDFRKFKGLIEKQSECYVIFFARIEVACSCLMNLTTLRKWHS